MTDLYLGIDIGSTTTKLVVVNPDGELLDEHYLRSHGQPRHTLLRASRTLPERFPSATIRGVGLTGSGGEPVAEVIGGLHINELVAQSRAVGEFHKYARTVIEIGGQDSKLLSLQWDGNSRQMVLLDFAMNALCAAGTGSFLDQQAERLGISIEDEFAEIALASQNPARVAGRCTVFAKSDIIHLQQQGTPLPDILAGLCLALARNFKTVIGKGKTFTPPVLFQGGVAYNGAVLEAFESVLGLEQGQLIVPKHHCFMAALGAAYTVMDEEQEGRSYVFHGFDSLEAAIKESSSKRSLPVLESRPSNEPETNWIAEVRRNGVIPAYLGIDVGSISTCLVLTDINDRIIVSEYLMTGGNPLAAVQKGLETLKRQAEGHVHVRGVGVTGSGRYLTGHFVGADVIRNEITAQARAAAAIDPDVDTIIEIGGQDSKYIRMHNGAVVDFAMNNACAAGTGSFLEEQADRLQISVSDDFSRLAFESPAPACLGERCTVFMESDLVHHQQTGAAVEDLTAGLAYSIVHNYLNRVVNGREIGNHILFQGGVASNRSVAAAFEQVLRKPITVPRRNRVTGAMGAALLAREAQDRAGAEISKFHGFDLADHEYDTKMFVCRACSNLCEIKKVTIQSKRPIFYGARCDKFEKASLSKVSREWKMPDLFEERELMLLNGYVDPGPRMNGLRRVGIPRALIMHELLPYWKTFFETLKIEVVLSAATNPQVIHDTQSRAATDCCFPVKLMAGHVVDLLKRDIDYMFLPGIVDREKRATGQTHSNLCPLIGASGELMKAHMEMEKAGVTPLDLTVYMSQPRSMKTALTGLARQLRVPARSALRAAEAGAEAQARFYKRMRQRGKEVLSGLSADQPAVVLVGRPYNTADQGACQNLSEKLRTLGALPIPIDFLPLSDVDFTDDHPNMYWRSGQDILAAAKIISEDDRLHAVYVTSFACGPDSFLVSYFRRMMDPKPFLELEMDDHTAEAGLVTRCEAFLDSLNLTVEAAS